VSHEFTDVWRNDGERYVASLPDATFVKAYGLDLHIPEAITGLLEKTGRKKEDIAKLVLYGPDARTHAALVRQLKFPETAVPKESVIGKAGNTGTASCLLGLAAALEEARPHDQILVVSYGNGAEALATRHSAAIFDETSFAKIEISGPGSSDFLQHLCANDVDRSVGTVVYTSMLNSRGGIECDFTVTRLGVDRFFIVTGTAFGNHDLGWIRKHAPEDGSVTVTDVTSARACFGLWGPRARDILAALDADGACASVTCSNGSCSGVVVPGTGIHLNNMLGEEDLNPGGFHRHQPGRRIPSMMAPTVVLRDGLPEVALGSAGSNRIRSAILQTILGVVNDGLAAQEAVDRPRVHWEGRLVEAEPGVDERALEAFERDGWPVQRFRERNLYFGGVQAVARDPETGELSGGGDPRRGGASVVVE